MAPLADVEPSLDGAIVVTGAASGIGRALVQHAAARGADLRLIDRDSAALDAVRDEALTLGAASATPAVCDVADEQQIVDAFASFAALGPVTGLFANAGIEVNSPVLTLDVASWNRVLAINLTGVLLSCREALKLMTPRRTGSIVCTSSPAAFHGFVQGGNASYAASKGGVSSLVRSLAVDHAPLGVRVNAVVPGAIDTPMLLAGTEPDDHDGVRRDIADAAREQIPMRRLGRADEVAKAVWWLLGPDSSYVTGSHLVCDGGLMARSANTF